MAEHLKIYFLRDLNPEIKITKEGTFEELESRAIDTERDLETVKAIRQIVLEEKTSGDNKRTTNASLRRVGTKLIKCQYCHKIGHTADCRLINANQPKHNFFSTNTNSARTNFFAK